MKDNQNVFAIFGWSCFLYHKILFFFSFYWYSSETWEVFNMQTHLKQWLTSQEALSTPCSEISSIIHAELEFQYNFHSSSFCLENTLNKTCTNWKVSQCWALESTTVHVFKAAQVFLHRNKLFFKKYMQWRRGYACQYPHSLRHGERRAFWGFGLFQKLKNNKINHDRVWA